MGMARPEGIEPPAYRFEACRSIHLSYGRNPIWSVADGSAKWQGCRAPGRGLSAKPPYFPPERPASLNSVPRQREGKWPTMSSMCPEEWCSGLRILGACSTAVTTRSVTAENSATVTTSNSLHGCRSDTRSVVGRTRTSGRTSDGC